MKKKTQEQPNMYTLENCLQKYPMLLTTKQVAEILQIGRNSTFNLLHSGVIRTVRCGRIIYTPKPALIDFINGFVEKDLENGVQTCYNDDGERYN